MNFGGLPIALADLVVEDLPKLYPEASVPKPLSLPKAPLPKPLHGQVPGPISIEPFPKKPLLDELLVDVPLVKEPPRPLPSVPLVEEPKKPPLLNVPFVEPLAPLNVSLALGSY